MSVKVIGLDIAKHVFQVHRAVFGRKGRPRNSSIASPIECPQAASAYNSKDWVWKTGAEQLSS